MVVWLLVVLLLVVLVVVLLCGGVRVVVRVIGIDRVRVVGIVMVGGCCVGIGIVIVRVMVRARLVVGVVVVAAGRRCVVLIAVASCCR